MASRIPPSKTRTVAAGLAVMAAVCSSNFSEAKTVEQMERYYLTCWRNAGIPDQEWNDCTQEAMLDLLQRIPLQSLSEAIYSPKSDERRELNRSVWCIVQRWRRAPRFKNLEGDYSDKKSDIVDAWVNRQIVDEFLYSDKSPLSETQRHILTHWVDGYSIAEIAHKLEMPAANVSDQKYKAIQRLRQIKV